MFVGIHVALSVIAVHVPQELEAAHVRRNVRLLSQHVAQTAQVSDCSDPHLFPYERQDKDSQASARLRQLLKVLDVLGQSTIVDAGLESLSNVTAGVQGQSEPVFGEAREYQHSLQKLRWQSGKR